MPAITVRGVTPACPPLPVPAYAASGASGCRFSIYVDVTGVWLNETVDHFEGGGFPTARWPDQDDKFTVWDLKTQVKDHLLVAIGQRNVFKFNQ